MSSIKRNMSVIVSNQFLTALADSIYDITIFWYVYHESQSALLASLITALSFTTQILIGPFLGVIADRRNPKQTMRIGFLLMTVVGVSLSVFYFFLADYFLILVYLGLLIHDVGMFLIAPAKNKLLPRIVGMEKIVHVNGYITSTSSAATILGNAISGFVIALIGFVGVMLTHSVLYILASLLLSFLVNLSSQERKKDDQPEQPEATQTQEEKKKSSYMKEIKEAFVIIKANRPLFKTIMLGMLLNIASIVGPLFVVLVSEQYNGSAVTFGWFNVFGVAAGIIAGFTTKNLVQKMKPFLLFGVAVTVAGFMFVILAVLTNKLIGMAIYFMLSYMLTIFNIAFSSLLITLVEDQYRGRVMNLTAALSALFIPAFTLLGGLLADVYSASILYIFAGGWIVLFGVIIFFDKDVRKIRFYETGNKSYA